MCRAAMCQCAKPVLPGSGGARRVRLGARRPHGGWPGSAPRSGPGLAGLEPGEWARTRRGLGDGLRGEG